MAIQVILQVINILIKVVANKEIKSFNKNYKGIIKGSFNKKKKLITIYIYKKAINIR